ncbi:hypothetical protein LOC67_03600 [Stieleria sp. JC731]|uniref:hypothetical protein n=1 Tax=Pirellulaceae TaxID=2691357 RepID=UPI001E610134|nr:hypothetical protein [Stieleria sp. JC731]MCC9599634.1 hypothetical protein [Stieleria sp. JC731]
MEITDDDNDSEWVAITRLLCEVAGDVESETSQLRNAIRVRSKTSRNAGRLILRTP